MRIYITNEDRHYIASTPERECHLCAKLFNAIDKDYLGYFVDTALMDEWDDGIEEHLRQLGIVVPVGAVGSGVAE